MKKRLSLGITGVALLCALAVTACQQEIPTEFTVQTNASIPSLPGPGNVQAVNVDGGVLLTWEPVYDAKGYEVWRRKNADGQISQLVTDDLDFDAWKYADIISDENKLEPNTEYLYTILAISGNSTGARSSVEVVQYGRTDKHWTTGTSFPDKGTPVTVAGLALNAAGGVFNLSWTKNANSAVYYNVVFSSSLDFDTEETAHALALVPTQASSQVYTATVKAYLGDGKYYPAVEQKVSALINASVENSVSLYLNVGREAQKRVKITFTQIDGAEYTLYRAESSNPYAALTWTEVSTAAKVLNASGSWEVIDDAATEKKWYYQIAAGISGTTIVSSIDTISKDTAPQVASLNVDLVPDAVTSGYYNATVNDTAYYLNFKFTAEAGVDYKVYRQKVGNEHGNIYVYPAIQGDWTEIPAAELTITDGLNSDRIIRYRVPEARQKYDYKIVGTKAGSRYNEWSVGYPYHAPLDPISTSNFGYSTIVGTVSDTLQYVYSGATPTHNVYRIPIYNIESAGATGGRPRAGESITIRIRPTGPNGVYSALPGGWIVKTSTDTVTVGPASSPANLSPNYYVLIPIPLTGTPPNVNDYNWIIQAVSK